MPATQVWRAWRARTGRGGALVCIGGVGELRPAVAAEHMAAVAAAAAELPGAWGACARARRARRMLPVAASAEFGAAATAEPCRPSSGQPFPRGCSISVTGESIVVPPTLVTQIWSTSCQEFVKFGPDLVEIPTLVAASPPPGPRGVAGPGSSGFGHGRHVTDHIAVAMVGGYVPCLTACNGWVPAGMRSIESLGRPQPDVDLGTRACRSRTFRDRGDANPWRRPQRDVADHNRQGRR